MAPFVSPGAFGLDALTHYLQLAQEQKRQALLDQLNQQNQVTAQADRARGLDLQQRGQDLNEAYRRDQLDATAQQRADALAAVAPPMPGMVGSVPSQFALPMDTPADLSGLTTSAPTAAAVPGRPPGRKPRRSWTGSARPRRTGPTRRRRSGTFWPSRAS